MKSLNITTGILTENTIPANAAVLVNTRKKGNDYVTEFLAVEGVKSTKAVDIILPLTALFLADLRTREGFKSEYDMLPYKVDGEQVHSGLSAKSLFTKFLKGDTIYKSDSHGDLTKALKLDDGLALRNTALKVTCKQAVFTAKGDDLKAALYNQAKAIVAQATLFSTIAKEQKSINDSLSEELKENAKAAAKKAAKADARA